MCHKGTRCEVICTGSKMVESKWKYSCHSTLQVLSKNRDETGKTEAAENQVTLRKDEVGWWDLDLFHRRNVNSGNFCGVLGFFLVWFHLPCFPQGLTNANVTTLKNAVSSCTLNNPWSESRREYHQVKYAQLSFLDKEQRMRENPAWEPKRVKKCLRVQIPSPCFKFMEPLYIIFYFPFYILFSFIKKYCISR